MAGVWGGVGPTRRPTWLTYQVPAVCVFVCVLGVSVRGMSGLPQASRHKRGFQKPEAFKYELRSKERRGGGGPERRMVKVSQVWQDLEMGTKAQGQSGGLSLSHSHTGDTGKPEDGGNDAHLRV